MPPPGAGCRARKKRKKNTLPPSDVSPASRPQPSIPPRRSDSPAPRQAYDETIQPLEKYVLLYLFFVAPAVLLATGWCSDHTNLTSTNCEAPCEMVLAARATVSAVVYFQKPESRQQLGDYHRLWTKTYQRLAKVFYFYFILDFDIIVGQGAI